MKPYCRHSVLDQRKQKNIEVTSPPQVPPIESREDESGNDIGKYTWKDRAVERHHSFLLPKNNIRVIIVGKSGFGKINYSLLGIGTTKIIYCI